MTIQCFLHSDTKRADAIALLDSGAIENFMNQMYAEWLHLPIKWLEKTRPLYNVNGTKNKAGELQYYTNLSCQTGGQHTKLQFFLSDLGEHKVILGYPWFAAMQPKIDWRKGWIDHNLLE
jgi:hypothetical protein